MSGKRRWTTIGPSMQHFICCCIFISWKCLWVYPRRTWRVKFSVNCLEYISIKLRWLYRPWNYAIIVGYIPLIFPVFWMSRSLSLKSEAESSLEDPSLEVLFDVSFDEWSQLCISDCKDAGSSLFLSIISKEKLKYTFGKSFEIFTLFYLNK